MSQVLQRTSATGTRATKVIGALAILVMAWVVISGLVLTPQDVVQGESVRIMYVHVPTAWVAYLAFIVTAVASACWLLSRKHSMGFVLQAFRPVEPFRPFVNRVANLSKVGNPDHREAGFRME